MQVLSLTINNFRGIKEFAQTFDSSNVVCFVGRGDSCKTTILQAINFVLYPQRWISIEDKDFYKGNVDEPIKIEIAIGKFSKEIFKDLCRDDTYGGFIHKWDEKMKTSLELWSEDSGDSEDQSCLKINFSVDKNLEPVWVVVSSNGTDTKVLHASDRAKFNSYLIEDYHDKHFTLGKGSPLMNLYKNQSSSFKDDVALQQIVRDIQLKLTDKKGDIFDPDFIKFCADLKVKLSKFNVNMSGEIIPSIVAQSFHTNNTNFIIADDNGPLQSKGKGTKRLSSIAIQTQLSNNVTLVDEVEQGLEPDRIKSLISSLEKEASSKDSNVGQIFLTTHSRDVLVELKSTDIYIIRNNDGVLTVIHPTSTDQGTVRRNPEALFGKKVLVCEGSTELGFIRAFENYRYRNNQDKLSYLGVVIVDGGGTSLVNYLDSYLKWSFPSMLLCDSDEKNLNSEKDRLRKAGLEIVEWEHNLCLEQVVALELPWDKILELLKLACTYKSEQSIYDSINNGEATPLDKDISKWVESEGLREKIGEKMNSGSWFKTHSKGEDLGDVIFNCFDLLPATSQIKTKVEQMTEWVKK